MKVIPPSEIILSFFKNHCSHHSNGPKQKSWTHHWRFTQNDVSNSILELIQPCHLEKWLK